MEKPHIAGVQQEYSPVPKILNAGDSRNYKNYECTKNRGQERPDYQDHYIPSQVVSFGCGTWRLCAFREAHSVHTKLLTDTENRGGTEGRRPNSFFVQPPDTGEPGMGSPNRR